MAMQSVKGAKTNPNTRGEDGQPRSPSYNLWMDAIGVVAPFCVVLLHVVMPRNLVDYGYRPLLIQVFAIWAVPVFYMLTGAKLMGYRERYDTKTYLLKRARKTFLPYLFWITFATVFRSLYPGELYLSPGVENAKISDYLRIFAQPHVRVYWFFIPLFLIYLAIPLLSLIKEKRRLLWGLTLSVMGLKTVLTPMALWIWPDRTELFTGGFWSFAGFLSYAVLGYLLSTCHFRRIHRLLCYPLFCGTSGLGYWIVSALFDKPWLLRQEAVYLFFPVVLLSVSVLVWFRCVPWERLGKRAGACLRQLSACGLGVYLIHSYVLDLARQWIPATGEIEWAIPTSLGAFALLLLLVWVLRKIPVLRHLVP
ncbi:MAG: acyltransferase [Oscillospiraceae bacterium]|jgi:LPXTG-motif cell wall-anchored protein|nr:acyltransferase [Oscillospiraceae bacterium]